MPTILDPDACQLELWIDRASGGRGTLLHAGPACRVGPVELGLNLDRFHADGSGTDTAGVLQLKWARELLPGLSAGIALAVGVRDHSPNFLGTSIVLPFTWQASESLRVHVNAGRDFVHGAADLTQRGGGRVERERSAGRCSPSAFAKSVWTSGGPAFAMRRGPTGAST